jgi:hypothetical protein
LRSARRTTLVAIAAGRRGRKEKEKPVKHGSFSGSGVELG